jgi:hypothetical protein
MIPAPSNPRVLLAKKNDKINVTPAQLSMLLEGIA